MSIKVYRSLPRLRDMGFVPDAKSSAQSTFQKTSLTLQSPSSTCNLSLSKYSQYFSSRTMNSCTCGLSLCRRKGHSAQGQQSKASNWQETAFRPYSKVRYKVLGFGSDDNSSQPLNSRIKNRMVWSEWTLYKYLCDPFTPGAIRWLPKCLPLIQSSPTQVPVSGISSVIWSSSLTLPFH